MVSCFLKKLKTELADDPIIALLSILPEEIKQGSQRGICTSMFTVALFTITKSWKQSKWPMMNEKTKGGTYTQWNIMQLTQE